MKPQYRLEPQLTPRAKDTIGSFPRRLKRPDLEDPVPDHNRVPSLLWQAPKRNPKGDKK